MDIRTKLQETVSEDVSDIDISDEHVLDDFTREFSEWWIDSFGEYVSDNNGFFTPPQRKAIPSIKSETNTLIASPTGSGKTLASFGSIIDELVNLSKTNNLENSIYCVYVSPLKSLANDIQKNLARPVNAVQDELNDDCDEIRHAIRHGDTTDAEKSKMLDETPHILNTTPETLAILLNSPRFNENFRTVEHVIVDEIHSVAGSKRGTHLSVSLERLSELSENDITRIGCSATVEPLDTVAKFLSGYEDGNPREYNIVDTRFVRETDIEVITPVDELIEADKKEIFSSFYSRLNGIIERHDTTLIFTNTRSGAESTLNSLRSRFDYDEDSSAAHHGSMSKQKREVVEDSLKNGEYKLVTSSTSLELGVDISNVDVVVQIGSPKTIAGLLQRIGRAGHQLGETVKGRIFVLDRDELIECSVMADRAESGYIDRVFIPERAHDVAAQQVYGMAINSVRPKKEIKRILKQSYPYRDYTDSEFENLLRYLKANYDGLEDNNIYPKIWCDTNDDTDGEYHYDEYEPGKMLIGKRGKKAQMIYMTNIGTIPDSFSITVKSRGSDAVIGELDEEYLNTLEKGDVFVLGGTNYEYKYRRGSNVYVDKTSRSPTVPSWFSERLPLSYDLGRQILQFQQKAWEKYEQNGRNGVRDYVDGFPIDEKTVDSLTNLMYQQYRYTDGNGISMPGKLFIEEHEDDNTHYYVHSVHGRQFNDGLSRILAKYFADRQSVNIEVSVNDHGFALTAPKGTQLDILAAIEEIGENQVRQYLRDSLSGTDFLQRYFRINATRSLAILSYYDGQSKSAKQQQIMSEMLLGASKKYEDFAPLEETYRELMESKLDLERVSKFLERDIDIFHQKVQSPSPRGFSLATLSSSDVVLADDKSEVLEKFHNRVLEDIED